jgi:hypothetical protein
MTVRDHEIELQFIREFSVGGNQLGACLSSEDRRERIRVAIYQNKLHDKIFRDSEITYAAAYRLCYGKALEMRRWPRVDVAMVPTPLIDEDDPLDDE